MTCLRVVDVHSIKEDCNLLVISTPNTHICLSSYRASLPYINAGNILQQIINTLYRRLGNILTAQYSYHSRLLAFSQWRTRCRHADFIELKCSSTIERVGGNLADLCRNAVSLGICQGSNTQSAHNHLSSQNGEQRVALVREMLELQACALVENCFVHIIIYFRYLAKYR